MTKELGIPIRHHAFGNAMELNYLLEIEVGNLSGIMSCMAWHKVSHLGEPIHYHHNGVLVPLCPRQPRNEIK